MAKRPSLFTTTHGETDDVPIAASPAKANSDRFLHHKTARRPPSREGKRILSIYLDPLAWKQLRQLALDDETTTQALGEEAINLLFGDKNGINRKCVIRRPWSMASTPRHAHIGRTRHTW